MPAGSRPARITATAFNVLQACPLIANSFFPMSSPRRDILFLSIRFQPDALGIQARGTTAGPADVPLRRLASSSLLCAAAVRSGVLHFLLGLAGFALLGLQGVGYGKIGLRLSGWIGLGSGWRTFGYSILPLIFGEFSEAFANLGPEVVVHVPKLLQAYR